MRVVVTGGAGFIGRVVVERLADRHDEIVALVRDPTRASFLQRAGVRVVASSLDDASALRGLMTGADVAIHGAGGGPCLRLADSIEIAARVGGRRAPRLRIPTALLRLMAPLNDRLGGLPGLPPNMRETISASAGVTYWVSHDRATRELGFDPRGLEQGVADTWGRA